MSASNGHDITLQGFDVLERRLKALGKNLGGKVLRSASSDAMNIVVKDARQNVPIGQHPHKTYKGRLVAPGFLSRNIKKRTWKSKDGRVVVVSVGMAAEAWYGGLLEKGWNTKGRNSRKISARKWLELALETQQRLVIDKLGQRLNHRIGKTIDAISK